MSKHVLLSGVSRTNSDGENESTKVFLANGDGDVNIKASNELNLTATDLSITAENLSLSGTTSSLCSSTVNIGTLTSTSVNLGSSSCQVNAKGDLKVEKHLFDSLDSAGSEGKVLRSTGTGVKWDTITVDNLNDTVVSVGGTSATTTVNLGSSSGQLNAKGNLKVEKALLDSLNSAGSEGKVLCSTGSGVKWDDIASSDNLNTGVVNVGGTSSTSTVNLGSSSNQVMVKGSLALDKALYDSLNSAGTTGKVLFSTGSGVKWDTLTDGLNSSTVSVGATATTTQVNIGQSSNYVNVKGALTVEKALYDSLNSAGTTNKVLFSTGSGVKWDNINFPVDKLNDLSVNIGGTSATTMVSIGSSSATSVNIAAGTIQLGGNVTVPFGKTLTLTNLADSSSKTGSDGQVLTKSALGVVWRDPAAKLSYEQGRTSTPIIDPTSRTNTFNPVTVTAPTATATYLLQGGFTMGASSGGQPSLACSFCVDQGNTSLTSNAVNVLTNISVNNPMAAQTSILGARCSNTNCVSYSYIYTVRTAGAHTFGLFTSATGDGGALFQSFLNVIQIG
jgi:hypothetical protein